MTIGCSKQACKDLLFESFKDLDFLKFQRIATIGNAFAGAPAPALIYVLAVSSLFSKYFVNCQLGM